MTAPTQTAPDAPQEPEAPSAPSRPSRPKKAPARAKSRAKKAKKSAPPSKGTNRQGAASRKIGPDARQEAFRLIVEGLPLAAIARRLKVKAHTIAAWRDSEEGMAALKKLRAAREQELGATVRNARVQLEAALPRAVQVLTDLLDAADPKVRMRAAAQVCDRGGVIRTERLIDGEDPDALDLTTLDPEELEQVRALLAKAARGRA